MSDLDKLIEAVEAGTIPRHDLDAFIPWRGLDALTNDSLDAYNGALDAAKRLHDALLPGWVWQVGDKETGLAYATVYPPHDFLNQSVGYAMDPARSWLLAILRAVKAKG